MPNRPEYLAVWLGIAKAGGATALINTNLAGASLAHSLNIVGARIAIVDATLLDALSRPAATPRRARRRLCCMAPQEACPRLDAVDRGPSTAQPAGRPSACR